MATMISIYIYALSNSTSVSTAEVGKVISVSVAMASWQRGSISVGGPGGPGKPEGAGNSTEQFDRREVGHT